MSESKPKFSAVMALKKYFAPNMPAAEFVKEIKALTLEAKQELAEGAARELGVELEVPEVGTEK